MSGIPGAFWKTDKDFYKHLIALEAQHGVDIDEHTAQAYRIGRLKFNPRTLKFESAGDPTVKHASEDLAVLVKSAFFAGQKQAEEDLGVSVPKENMADAPEINILRRGWPDPLKKAKRLHEKDVEKNRGNSEDVKEKTRLTKHSPDVTIG